jgi:hypothetical protein
LLLLRAFKAPWPPDWRAACENACRLIFYHLIKKQTCGSVFPKNKDTQGELPCPTAR